MSSNPRVFISYSRHDGEAIAQDIRQALTKVGVAVWQDRTDMEGGRSWWKQITEALDNVAFMVLVATQGALDSSIVRREWQYARQQGVCIYPVVAHAHAIDFTLLPNWMRKAHFYDLTHEWDKFLIHLQGDCHASRVPFLAPEMVGGYVERAQAHEQLLASLLDEKQLNPIATTVALRGAGGFGKTTVASALCHDDRIITAFDDGILWVSLGENPDLLNEVTKLYRALSGDKTTVFIDVEEATQRLSERLEDLDCLLVLDDVWASGHLRPFMRGGEHCARLITTRNFEIANDYAKHHIVVDQMARDESLTLLTSRLNPTPTDLAPFKDLAKRLGEMPLMLELVSETLRQRMGRGDNLDGALKWVNKALDKRGMRAFDKDNADQRHHAISRTIDVSMELLTAAEQAHYIELAIFPEDVDIPLSAAGALWGMDEFDTESRIQRFFDLSLLRFDLQAGIFRLHDVVRAYLRERFDDEAALHQRLIAGWGDVVALPDDYAWRWLTHHLAQAHAYTSLRDLLLNFTWLDAKLRATDPNTLLIDYDRALQVQPDEALAVVQSALRNAAHVLVNDPTQLAGQLIGRLLAFPHPAIHDLIEQARAYCATAWVEPLTPSLPQAGGPLLRTIQGHRKIINKVRSVANGQRALSASSDGTVKIWDLATGYEIATFNGHKGKKVSDAVLTSDGQHLITGGSDYQIHIWEVATQQRILTLSGHKRVINAVAVTPDKKFVLSVDSDNLIRVFDFATGVLHGEIEGHTNLINALVIAANGQLAITGATDKTLKVWDLTIPAAKFVLAGHTGSVNAVVISADSRVAVSACDDGGVKVWDLVNGVETASFIAHTKAISGLALSADATRLITASADLTLKVWDLNTQTLLFKLTGHTWPINAVDMTADGQLAISAAADRTIKIWQLTKATAETEASHQERVNSVAISGDNQFAISAAEDDTLKVWDLATCHLSRTLHGHLQRVNDVAVLPNGRYGVSASSDGMLKVWDIISGLETHTFEAHPRGTNAVTITPDGKHIISGGSDALIKIWSLASGLELMTLAGHKERVNSLAVTPDGKYLISAAGAFFGRNFDLRLWDLATGDLIATWVGHERKVNKIAITPDGKRLITASDDYTLKVWDIATQQELFVLQGHTERVNTVSISYAGNYALSGGDDGQLKVWDLSTGKEHVGFHTDDALFACAIGIDNQTIVAAGASGKVHFLRLHGC